jgi:ADP-ribose pyrophosphatase
MAYTIVQSESVFQGKVFNVRVDQVQYPDGKVHRVDVVEHHGAVALVPIDADGGVWFVRQYRHPVGKMLLEIPAGTLEHGEKPQDCAIRECQEELGLAPDEIIPLGSVYLAPGYSTEMLHIFLARGLQSSPLPPDEDEVLEPVKISWQQVQNMIQEGEIRDAKTLAGIMLAQSHLGRA